MAGAGLAMRSCDQLMKDAALPRDMTGAASAAQRGELPFKRPHTLQSRLYTLQLRVYQAVDVTTV